MFAHENEIDRFGKTQTRYWLTQGDSFGIIARPIDAEGNVVDSSLIQKVMFKLVRPEDHIIIFQKAFESYNEGKFILRGLSSETSDIPVRQYNYEIEYTFTDGSVNTPNQWRFCIIPQGKEE